MNTYDAELPTLNPFETLGDAFAGRMPELDWIADGLAKGAHLLLQGAEGMGKTSLVEKAAEWLAQKTGGDLLRVESTANPESIVKQLHDWSVQLEHRMYPSRDGRGREQGTIPGTVDPIPITKEENLFSVLRRLNGIAARATDPVAVCFDDFKNPLDGAAHPLQRDLAQALKELPNLGLLVATPEKNLPFADGLTNRVLGPVEPMALAKSIDQRFVNHAAAGANIGQRCVELGGPCTAEVIDLARRTFDEAKKTGLATAATVGQVLDDKMGAKAEAFVHFWQTLPETEKKVLQQISKTAGEYCTPQHLADLASATRTVASLVGKKALGELPWGGALYFLDAAFKNWVGETSLQIGASANIPPNGPKSFQFNFGLTATAKRLQPTP